MRGVQYAGYRLQDTGYKIQDTVYKIQDTGLTVYQYCIAVAFGADVKD